MHLAREFQEGFENSSGNVHKTLDICLQACKDAIEEKAIKDHLNEKPSAEEIKAEKTDYTQF